ncbi:ABC transporter substrate-binding protein [Bosea massiliensis]|uniref:ABC transporter substrate-binding protein n=1 Tax=Bosea massiliensis TaxID=151419 RepID=A0ABW0P9W4_9HYPH
MRHFLISKQKGDNMTKFVINRRAAVSGLITTLLSTSWSDSAFAAGNIRVGALNPVTGAAAAFGAGMQKTIIAASERINAQGGAGGRRFEIFAEDSQTLPEPALLAARKLIEVNKVHCLLGVYSSPEALAIIPVTNASNVVLMHNGAAPKLASDNTKGLGFQFYPSSNSIGFVLDFIAAREAAKKPVTLTLTNDASIGNTAAFAARWKTRTGTAPGNIQYQPNQPNYRSELQTLLALNPDLIVLNGYEPDATILVKQLYELGNSAPIVAPEFAATPRLVSAVGKDIAEGLMVYRFTPSRGSPAYKEFDAIYQEAMKTSGAGNNFAAMAFDQVVLVALALEAAPNANNGAEIARAIRQICGPEGEVVNSFAEGRELLKKGVKNLNYQGASGPVDFDKEGRTPANFSVSTIKNAQSADRYDVGFER